MKTKPLDLIYAEYLILCQDFEKLYSKITKIQTDLDMNQPSKLEITSLLEIGERIAQLKE